MFYSNAIVFLWGCGGGPSLSITSNAAPGLSAPKNLADVIEKTITPQIQSCYTKDGYSADASLSLLAKGSHGILKVEIEEQNSPVLLECVEGVFGKPRTQRMVADFPTEIGFGLEIVFGR
jgi:hypothetical protein